MIEILKKNTKFDQPLYVASATYNENYLKIAEDCGGELIHSGPVPENIIDSYYDKNMKNVSVYRFNIEKEKERKL